MTDFKNLADELEGFPSVNVTTVVFSRDFADIGCCVIPDNKVAEIVAALRDAASQLARARKALGFYADSRRYDGPNLHPIPDDPYQPTDLVYRLDVTRDLGRIAKAAMTDDVGET